MPFKKLGKDRYEGPSGRVFTKKQVEVYYAHGERFPGRKQRKAAKR